MIRIVIEIDGTEVSSTVVQPTGILGAPPQELLARAAALGALDAGSAPSEFATFAAAAVAPAAGATAARADRAHQLPDTEQ